ncbi:hypothetical protein [Extibacter muris]|nr:hypothetical protein [Extibacter muris]
MKIINKKIMILFYVSIYTFAIIGGAYYIISSVPCLMNKDFAIQRGKIQSVSLYEKNSIGTKYNIILVDENGKYNQVDHVFSDDLKEGDQLLLLQLWEKGVWIYCIIIMISLFNLVDNKILGVIGAIVFLIYTFSSFLSLMLEGKMYKIKHE